MLASQKDFLFLFGWDDFFENHYTNLFNNSLIPAKVICEEKNLYRIQIDLQTTTWASINGKMYFNAKNRSDFPAVGDWVLIEPPCDSDRAIIQSILPRKGVVQRKEIGSSTDIQILATNIDYMFIASSADHDLSAHRIERYLTIAYESGTIPVILITKTDCATIDIHILLDELKERFPHVNIHTLSKDNFTEAEFFKNYLKSGITSVVVGSSGVGKSTLVNFFIGDDKIKTQEVRTSDSKGRHTTTSRNLYRSHFGGLVIDTPGMRELQLLDHQDGLETQFSDIEDTILRCRFSDCRHETEPGCAIREALDNEDISESKWKNYKKLEAEIRHGLRKQDKVLHSEDKKAWKKKVMEGRERGISKRRPR